MGLAEFYREARGTYPFLPPWANVRVRVDPSAANVEVVMDLPTSIVTFTEPPGFVWTREVAFHEIGHLARRVLQRTAPATDWDGLYWSFRGFGGNWRDAKTYAESPGGPGWVGLPDESWAEAFGASIAGRWIRNEKTMDYGKPVGALAARSFFLGLVGTPMTYPIVWKPSPNFSRGWATPARNIALHSAAGTLTSLLSQFAIPGTVSAHFTINPGNRTIYQHVDLANRAWHAMSANEFAVGIEHVDGGPWGPHPEITYDMSAWLVDRIATDFGLAINETVVGPHQRWVPTACPAALDWRRVVAMAAGGNVAYLTEEQFNAWRVLLQKQLETTLAQRWEMDRVVGGLLTAGGQPRTARRGKPPKFTIPALPKFKPTAKQVADVRLGHGRGSSKDVEV